MQPVINKTNSLVQCTASTQYTVTQQLADKPWGQPEPCLYESSPLANQKRG